MSYSVCSNYPKVVGFAVMIELEDGTRAFVYSNDVDGATFTQTIPMPSLTSDELEGRYGYDIHLSGEHLNFQFNVEPLQNILEQNQDILEQKEQRQLTMGD